MEIDRIIDNLPTLEKAFVTIGNFDGLHLGHQKIFNRLINEAGDSPKVVITFDTAPAKILHPENFAGYIFPDSFKQRAIELAGIDYLYLLDFNKVRNMTADDFIRLFLERINNLHLYVGYDFRFGRGHTGTAKFLEKEAKRLDFELTEIERYKHKDITVNSTGIRELVIAGDVETAGAMLGRPYFIVSAKTHGDGVGATIGFPTINQAVPTKRIVPAVGVYFTYCKVNNKFLPSMTYIGHRPTVNGIDLRIETNVIGYKSKFTAKKVEIAFISKINKEKTFKNLDNLQKMLYNYSELVYELSTDYKLPINFLKLLGGN